MIEDEKGDLLVDRGKSDHAVQQAARNGLLNPATSRRPLDVLSLMRNEPPPALLPSADSPESVGDDGSGFQGFQKVLEQGSKQV